MKVIHLPTPTGGNAWGLSRGERSVGLTSDVLYKNTTWLKYPYDINPPESSSRVIKNLKQLSFFHGLVKEYDVFHYNFGQSFFDWPGTLDLFELPFLQGKKIFVTYNGCDARQKYKQITHSRLTCCHYDDCHDGCCNEEKVDRLKDYRIRKFKKYNAGFFALNPDIMNYLPEDTVFLPYTIARWEQIVPLQEKSIGKKAINIVHAPTDRVVKGTDAVVSAVNNLEKKYPGQITLSLIENIAHDQALKEYANTKADIVIDQLRLGWYGGFAVEAMKMGKPVIAYINPDDLHFIPKQMERDCCEAIINANEYTLESVLMHYMNNRPELDKVCEAQLEYVHRWHDPHYVATITKEKYEEW